MPEEKKAHFVIDSFVIRVGLLVLIAFLMFSVLVRRPSAPLRLATTEAACPCASLPRLQRAAHRRAYHARGAVRRGPG